VCRRERRVLEEPPASLHCQVHHRQFRKKKCDQVKKLSSGLFLLTTKAIGEVSEGVQKFEPARTASRRKQGNRNPHRLGRRSLFFFPGEPGGSRNDFPTSTFGQFFCSARIKSPAIEVKNVI